MWLSRYRFTERAIDLGLSNQRMRTVGEYIDVVGLMLLLLLLLEQPLDSGVYIVGEPRSTRATSYHVWPTIHSLSN